MKKETKKLVKTGHYCFIRHNCKFWQSVINKKNLRVFLCWYISFCPILRIISGAARINSEDILEFTVFVFHLFKPEVSFQCFKSVRKFIAIYAINMTLILIFTLHFIWENVLAYLFAWTKSSTTIGNGKFSVCNHYIFKHESWINQV